MQPRCIDKNLACVDHFGHADCACLDRPLLYLQLFNKHRHHLGLILVPTMLAARVLELCQT
jgi:hypothetical protein